MKRKLRNKTFFKLKDIFWKKSLSLQHEKCQFVDFVDFEIIFAVKKCLYFAELIFAVNFTESTKKQICTVKICTLKV